jgi:aspartate aminotransferase
MLMSMEQYRKKIVDITERIIELVAEREKISEKIAIKKREDKIPIDDAKAEENLIDIIIERSKKSKVDIETTLNILSVLISDSKRVQRNILGTVDKQRMSPMAMASIAMDLQRSGRKLYRLDVGEPDFHPPQRVIDACNSALRSFKTHYTRTRGIPELTHALSSYLKKKHRYDADEEQVMVTPGGRFAIYSALASILKQGESAIIIEPNWPMYREALEYLGCRCIAIHTELEDSWEPSVDEINERIKSHTKAIILSYPCNPTGKVISRDKFRQIIELARDRHLIVLSDEIYNDYAYVDCPSILDFNLSDFVLTSSFSKTWAMTGFRIGYAVSSPGIIERMLKVSSLMITSVPEFIQYGAIAALESEEAVEKNSLEMRRRIEIAVGELEKIGSLEFMKPDGGMYVFPRIKGKNIDSSEFAMNLLKKRGVSITPGSGFGDYPDFFRISLGQNEETIKQGIRSIGMELD